MLDNITPVILTYNEEPNIARTLQALYWAKRIVVIDSLSDDTTKSICASFANVDFIEREFDQHAVQWNFAIAQDIKTDWILALDADHVVSHQLVEELASLNPDPATMGYWAKFVYKTDGKSLRGSLYPPLISLYRTGSAHYLQDGHTQRVVVREPHAALHYPIYHDDRKSWQRWMESQKKYAAQEATKLSKSRWGDLSWPDKLRVVGLAPLIVLPYTLLIKGLLFSGSAGWRYAWQRFVAELQLQFARLKNFSD